MSLKATSSWARLSVGVATALRTAAELGDEESVRRMKELQNRMKDEESRVDVAFVGLFSAGKSSLINRLCEADLATGAIPTTAEVSRWVLPGTDGRVVLLDTPGIDSTYVGDHQVTQSALAMADAVVLVSDYAHMESEEILQFAHDLSVQGQPLVWVVHQIDKHYEAEVSLDTFRQRLEQTLFDWDIQRERVFYTTSRFGDESTAVPVNDLLMLTQWLQDLVPRAESLIKATLIRNVRNVLQDFVHHQFADALEETEMTLMETLGFVPFSSAEAMALWTERHTRQQVLMAQRTEEQSALAEEMERTRAEFVRKVELAQIVPYETAERGRLYIESLRQGFRASRFATRAKTEREMTRRREEFLADLQNRAEKFLTQPLANDLRAWVRQVAQDGGKSAELNRLVDAIEIKLDGNNLVHTVKEGSLLSDAYSHQFVKDVVAQVKAQVQGKIDLFWDAAWQWRQLLKDQTIAPQVQELNHLERELNALQGWMTVAQKSAQTLMRLEGELADE